MRSTKDNSIERALEYVNIAIGNGVTAYRIAKDTKLSENTITNYIKGKTKPTLVNADILNNYFEKKDIEPFQRQRELDLSNFMLVSLVPISARAGYLQGYGDLGYVDNLPTIPVLVDREYKGNYRIFEVAGDSMLDGSVSSFCDKDKVLCREVRKDLWQYKLHFKDWFFVIVHKTDGILLKQITAHDVSTGSITCHSLNSLYDDFELHLNDIVELYNVVKLIERNPRV